jgi:dTDP-4-amino-4,6-dideoxygalactose transaminase
MHDLNFAEWPCYEPDEIAAVTRVLESGKVNYWTGEKERFEGKGERSEGGGQRTEDGGPQ